MITKLESRKRWAIYQRWYADYGEMIARAIDRTITAVEGEHSPEEMTKLYSRVKTDSHAWDYGKDWAETVRMATVEGWPAGTKGLGKMLEKMEAPMASMMETQRTFYDVSGGSVDVAAFLEGAPECFMNHEPHLQHGDGKVLTVCFQSGIDHNTNGRSVYVRGAAVLCLVDLLERMGYQVRILLSEVTESEAHYVAIEDLCYVKEAGEPVHMNRLAFVLCHPVTPRRIIMSLMEQRPARLRKLIGITPAGNYGRPARPSLAGYSADLVIPQAKNFISTETALEWIKSALTAQGAIFTPAR